MISSLPYHEPNFLSLLISSSFLLVANFVEYLLDHFLYCGLLGPLFIGIAWGAPGAGWLSIEQQGFISQLGYIGLILIVYEGGLSTSLPLLWANLVLSTLVALTGILLPIAFSFILTALVKATSLQAFAAGAALCSTSLGTAFTVLITSNLNTTRLGIILTSSAMLDDVVGLIMLQIMSNLGSSQSQISPTLIVRPIFVSIGLVVVAFAVCRFLVRPLTTRYYTLRGHQNKSFLAPLCDNRHTPFIIHTCILIGLIAVASYAQTSNLFAAYIAGVCISWWDSLDRLSSRTLPTQYQGEQHSIPAAEQLDTRAMAIEGPNTSQEPEISRLPSPSLERAPSETGRDNNATGVVVFETYLLPALKFVLRPFFFASLGFAIPISKMFDGEVVWKGVVYTVLMIFAKLACGLWLVRWPLLWLPSFSNLPGRLFVPRVFSNWKTCVQSSRLFKLRKSPSKDVKQTGSQELQATRSSAKPISTAKLSVSNSVTNPPLREQGQREEISVLPDPSSLAVESHIANENVILRQQQGGNSDLPTQSPAMSNEREPNVSENDLDRNNIPQSNKSSWLYPVAILGSAMVARGEIGFLISSVAHSKRVFSEDHSSDTRGDLIFLIVTWAIMGCTIIGPIIMGVFVRRVRNYAQRSTTDVKEQNVLLGVWGEVSGRVNNT